MSRDPIVELLREWRVPTSDRLKALERHISGQMRAHQCSGGGVSRLRCTALLVGAGVLVVMGVKLLLSLSTVSFEPATGSSRGHAVLHTARHSLPRR